MDKDGKKVLSEKEALGMKVSTELVHPHLFATCDEVGSNTSMEGDSEVGTQKFICAKNDQPKRITT